MVSAKIENRVTGRALLITCRGLAAFLDTLPNLALSPKGRENVARRFGLREAELAAALAAYEKGRKL